MSAARHNLPSTREAMDGWALTVLPLDGIERDLRIADKATALEGIVDDPLVECLAALARVGGNGSGRAAAPATGYELNPLDFPALLRDGVPEVEYHREPYFPKGARIWIWGATGSYKSLWAEHEGAALSRNGVRVSYFQEENPLPEELRRLAKLQPDPAHFRLFHRSGMDLLDERWVDTLLRTTRGDEIVFLDSLTDLWSGDEGDNRAVQMFDAAVLKPLQRQGVTPVVLHHTGHHYIGSDRGGATAGRGASSLGQKADVVLEFKAAGEDLFTIVYGKCRIGGINHGERSFRVEDTDDGCVEIVESANPEEIAVRDLAEKIVQLVHSAPAGRLTASELRTLIGGSKARQTAAFALLEDDLRIRQGVEKQRAADGKMRDAKVFRPSGVGDAFDFAQDGDRSGNNPSPYKGGEGLPTSICMPSNPSRSGEDALGPSSPKEAS